MSANVNSMMYVGETPWHGEGTKLDKVATSAEAMEAAGLDWKVEKRPIYAGFGPDGSKPIPWKFATCRMDTQTPLGVVGAIYRPLQNKEAFSFFDSIVGVKEAMYHTAGALGDGERVWILAKLPGYIRVKGDDVSEKFLLLVNSHDGSRAVQMMFTPIRVVCQNTLNLAVDGSELQSKIRHTTNIGERVQEVRETLGIINEKFALFEQLSQRLAVTQLTKDAWNGYLKTLKLAPSTADEATTRLKNIGEQVTTLFHTGKGATMPSAKGTAWGAFNAVVEYVDYCRGSDQADNRTKSLLFGSGADLKQRAWDAALALTPRR